MKKLTVLILLFAVAFAVFFIAPPLLGKPFSPYPLMSVADVLDVFTPLVLLPLYGLLYVVSQEKPVSLSGILVFLVFAALWAEGQGMHLSANSIGNLMKGVETGDVFVLTFFYDELLSHYLWHFGIVGLSAFLIFEQWRSPLTEGEAPLWPVVLAGIIHGFTYFLIVIEAGTALLGVTFAILAVLFGLIWGRRRMSRQPLITFFLLSYAIATLFFIGWGVYWHGLPQFSEVGLI